VDWLNKAKKVAGDAASQAKTKVERSKLRHKADEAAQQLGYLVYRERTGGEAAGAEADRLIGEITAAEEELAAEPAEGGPAGDTGPEAPATEA
jgi:hypothetical protein